ncbi:MAG: DUF433 domain-containing protein [Polaribacter sp.]|nr:DUF433 domain-containing protein [Polaribacter sp.]
MIFETKSTTGTGIYTIPDLAEILNLKYYKVQRLLSEYWDKRFADQLGINYSWSDGKSKAVSFHTLVEFYIFFQLKEIGVSTTNILKAHSELSEMFSTPFPFANSSVINGINCVGKKVLFEVNNEDIINLDSSKQLNLKFIKHFASKLDFDQESLAVRLWPLGKEKSIVVDPNHKFGRPIIKGSNIYPETIYQLYLANEPINFIASSFSITENEVDDAIEFCKKAA